MNKKLLLTLKYFFKLKWQELAKDEMPEWGEGVLFVSCIIGLWVLNCAILSVFFGYRTVDLENTVAFGFISCIVEVVALVPLAGIFVLIKSFNNWIKDNWRNATRLAEAHK